MEFLASFLAPVFWGVLLLSLLVFVHEGGHFLAARACGVRVTEFFLGLPCRFNIHRASRRIGTKFGITPLLLGGYAAICGMDPEESPHAADVLDLVHRRGSASVAEISSELSITEEEALDCCAFLLNWGSIAPVYDASKGEGPHSKFYPSAYASMPRDREGNTVYDGRAFDRAHATAEGDPWISPGGARAFLDAERAHTYIGKGFWKRAFMLVAGIGVNLLTGVLLFVVAYSVIGAEVPVDSNVLGSVSAGSPAAESGIVVGDRILAIDGHDVATWTEVTQALESLREDGSDGAVLRVWTPDADASPAPTDAASEELSDYLNRNGKTREVAVIFGEDGMIGIGASHKTVRLDPLTSAKISIDFLGATAQVVAKLLMPQHAKEILDSSSSIVGISVMSAEAAEEGANSFLSLASLISFSLGFMNLLPIPPLDGGKLLIESIQAVTRREVPIKIQLILSYVGIALFGFLFLYMLRGDILRLL